MLKEGVQDLQERQQWGEITKAFHGMVDPALAIAEDLPWKSVLWPITLFWWSTPALRGRIWTTLLSGKELDLEEGKCISHGLLSPRFPALHKPMASHPSDPVSPSTHTTLLSHWVLQ